MPPESNNKNKAAPECPYAVCAAPFFEGNPLPMWIYDLETLAFLAVNDAGECGVLP